VHRSAKRSTAWLGVTLIALLSIFVSHTIISRIGVDLFVFALAGILVALLFPFASFLSWSLSLDRCRLIPWAVRNVLPIFT
jgi:hypothetical protein